MSWSSSHIVSHSNPMALAVVKRDSQRLEPLWTPRITLPVFLSRGLSTLLDGQPHSLHSIVGSLLKDPPVRLCWAARSKRGENHALLVQPIRRGALGDRTR